MNISGYHIDPLGVAYGTLVYSEIMFSEEDGLVLSVS